LFARLTTDMAILSQGSHGLAAPFLMDPWLDRDDYIDVILDRSQRDVESFFSKHAARTLLDKDKIEVLKLLEIQRNGMLMYTSC